MTYFDALTQAMSLVADAGYLITGQAVRYPGTAMYNSLKHLPEHARLEMPVAEDLQLGHAIGLSLAGQPVLTCYPRQNFLLLALNQLVNHLDALPRYSDYRPKVLVRVAVPTPEPLDPGPQHLGDFTRAIGLMLHTVSVHDLQTAEAVLPVYRYCLMPETGSHLIVEHTELY